MRAWLLLGLGCLLPGPAFLGGCSTLPAVAARAPWFATERDLRAKAAHLEASALASVDRSGLLLYVVHEPLADRANYLKSHDLADAPAWQGYLLAALAFAEAVSGEDRDPEIRRLAAGLERFYEVTGVRGLLGRSMIADYRGPRLAWMCGEEERPTRFWMRGPTGAWWRNGLAKAHLTLACFGCAIPLILDRRGAIALEDETRRTLLRVLLPAVRRVVEAGFRIRDWDGRFTEYGNLGPQFLNGFNMIFALSLLGAASPYDRALHRVYEEKVAAWGPRIGWSLDVLGRVLRFTGHRWIGKPSYSDLQAVALAAISLLMQEHRRGPRRHLARGLRGLWRVVRRERNAPFTIAYAALVRPGAAGRAVAEMVADLRDFPADKHPRSRHRVSTTRVQPLANRPIGTNYWKSSPFRRVVGRPGPPEKIVYTGQDYLLAYWMGRYFGLVPPE